MAGYQRFRQCPQQMNKKITLKVIFFSSFLLLGIAAQNALKTKEKHTESIKQVTFIHLSHIMSKFGLKIL